MHKNNLHSNVEAMICSKIHGRYSAVIKVQLIRIVCKLGLLNAQKHLVLIKINIWVCVHKWLRLTADLKITIVG